MATSGTTTLNLTLTLTLTLTLALILTLTITLALNLILFGEWWLVNSSLIPYLTLTLRHLDTFVTSRESSITLTPSPSGAADARTQAFLLLPFFEEKVVSKNDH